VAGRSTSTGGRVSQRKKKQRLTEYTFGEVMEVAGLARNDSVVVPKTREKGERGTITQILNELGEKLY